MESKKFSYKFVTADEKLYAGECELIYACLVPTGSTTNTHIYNGVDTSGDKVITLHSATARMMPFSPKVPVYCRKGLYIDVGSSVTGVFVQWREL